MADNTPFESAFVERQIVNEGMETWRTDLYLSAMESLGFSGAIIVDHEGDVVLRKGYGLADQEMRRPYTPTLEVFD